jgi:hypothetical protein
MKRILSKPVGFTKDTNSRKHLADGSFEFKLQELVRLEFETTVTFANVARTKYSMGNARGGNTSSNNAEKAYRTGLSYFAKLSEITPSDRLKLTRLGREAKDALAALPKQKRSTPIQTERR